MARAVEVILIVHIASGFIALIGGVHNMVSRKGSLPHRFIGRIFFAAMTGVFVTATVLSVVKGYLFLFMVGFLSYYFVCTGYRILYLRDLHRTQRAANVDWLISVAALLTGIALVSLSIPTFQDEGMFGLVPLAFGLIILFFVYRDFRSYYARPQSARHWIFKHGMRMGAAFASTVTAFVLVNFSLGTWTWVLWLLPTLLILSWASLLLRPYRKAPSGRTLTPS